MVNDPLKDLIEALRQELQQYGEMLLRLDQQQECLMRRATDEILAGAASIQEQTAILHRARGFREEMQRHVAQYFSQPARATLAELTGHAPAQYRPLLQALIEENNALLVRVQQRARQNQTLLRRSVDLMQELLQSLLPPGHRTVYDEQGNCFSSNQPASLLCDAAV
jgi:hypothetical protein